MRCDREHGVRSARHRAGAVVRGRRGCGRYAALARQGRKRRRHRRRHVVHNHRLGAGQGQAGGVCKGPGDDGRTHRPGSIDGGTAAAAPHCRDGTVAVIVSNGGREICIIAAGGRVGGQGYGSQGIAIEHRWGLPYEVRVCLVYQAAAVVVDAVTYFRCAGVNQRVVVVAVHIGAVSVAIVISGSGIADALDGDLDRIGYTEHTRPCISDEGRRETDQLVRHLSERSSSLGAEGNGNQVEGGGREGAGQAESAIINSTGCIVEGSRHNDDFQRLPHPYRGRGKGNHLQESGIKIQVYLCHGHGVAVDVYPDGNGEFFIVIYCTGSWYIDEICIGCLSL